MANQISSFNMAKMTVGACANFHATTVKYITATTPEVLHIENKFAAYQEKVNLLESIVNRQQTFVSTGKLKRSDAVRDNAGGVITGSIHLNLTTPVEAKRMAAELLNPQVSAYRNIRYHEYNKQTAEVRGFLRVLDLPENQAAIETLNLKEEVEALRAANAEFEKYYDERVLEASERKDIQDINTEELIDETNTLYRELVQIMNAYAIVQSSEELNAFIAKMNGLVASLAAASGSSSSGSDLTTDDTETPDEENPDTQEPENPDGGDGGDEENPSGPGIPNP